MSIYNKIDQLSIKGFKSIRSMENLKLGDLNVLIGANGVGKSNFISYFRMLSELVECRLQNWIGCQGSADRILSFGVKETDRLYSHIEFGRNAYEFTLQATVDASFIFENEVAFFNGDYVGPSPIRETLGRGLKESKLKEAAMSFGQSNIPAYCYKAISDWKIFHFHDTSDSSGVKRIGALHDNEYLRSDASNLAAYLFFLSEKYPDVYQQITKTVRLGIPFFDSFVLKPVTLKTEEQQIRLLWRQNNSDYALWPSQLSDGSIRFICLVTALFQPNPPSTIIIDEPELGLHPYAITLLGALLRAASKRMQVIISTQSVALVNEFVVGDLIVVEREDGDTVFKRYDEKDFKVWLEDYSIGELWSKNILGGRP